MTFTLHALNPAKKKRGSKKKRSGRAAKKTTKRKARAKSPAKTAMAKKKRSRSKRKSPVARAYHAVKRRISRASNPKKKHRRRRRNPSGRAMLGGLKKGLPSGRELLGVGIGVIAVSGATKMLAEGAPLFAGSGPSSIAGEPWNAKQYAAALGVAAFGGGLVNRFLPGAGHAVSLAAIVFTVAKTVMPLVGKSPSLSKYLGESEGDVRVDEDGQTWILQGGRWNAMQGLVDATPMDGLVETTALDAIDDDYGITTSSLSVNNL